MIADLRPLDPLTRLAPAILEDKLWGTKACQFVPGLPLEVDLPVSRFVCIDVIGRKRKAVAAVIS